MIHYERRGLQLVVAILGLVPVCAGLDGAIRGEAFLASGTPDISLDSHFRYLSGLLLAIGLGFWSTIPAIEKRNARFSLLTAIVFAGGLARLGGILAIGVPRWPMILAVIIELLVTPLLFIWQRRVARNAVRASI
jgi:hypothetical protein